MPIDLSGEEIPLQVGGGVDHDWSSGLYRFTVRHATEPHYEGYPLLECEGDVHSMTVDNMVVHYKTVVQPKHFVKTAPET